MEITRLLIVAFTFVFIFMATTTHAASSNCLTTTTIGPNQTTSASLNGSECTLRDLDPDYGDLTYIDLYKLTITSTAIVSIAMDSSTFDTYLKLYDGDDLTTPLHLGFIISNDDVNTTTTNSIITVTLDPGTYIVLATSFYNYETGTYTLSTSTPSSSNCLSTNTIGPNQTITASLDGSECFYSHYDSSSADFSYLDLFKFRLVSPAIVNITMESNAFDTYLALYTDAIVSDPLNLGIFVAGNNDADTTTTNSSITVPLDPGSYIVVANSYLEYKTGEYRLITASINDSDKDGIPDNLDSDDDNDGMPDTFEDNYNFNPFDPSDSLDDADRDGFSNLREYKEGTDPRDPRSTPAYKPMSWLPLLLK